MLGRPAARLGPLLLAAASAGCASPPPPLVPDHAWIVVATSAPERASLERAGFLIAPTVNRHDGQGTASITVEFDNAFLELTWPDPSVPVSPALKAGAEKFRLKSRWRETGYSPLGIVFARTPETPAVMPFPTWRIVADWMEPGTSIEMLTPKETPRAVSLSISSHVEPTRKTNEALARDPATRTMLLHPNGTRRLTRLRVMAPTAEALPPAASFVAAPGLMEFDVGGEWLLEVTLDEGAQGRAVDFRPELPLAIRY